MDIRIFASVSDRFEVSKSNLINTLSSALVAFFKDKDYGHDVKDIEIGFLLVFTREGYEEWHKPKRLTYIDYRKTKYKYGGNDQFIEIHKRLQYEIRPADRQVAEFFDASDSISQKMLADAILSSLPVLDALSKKVKDFDKGRFREDMTLFLKGY